MISGNGLFSKVFGVKTRERPVASILTSRAFLCLTISNKWIAIRSAV